MKYTEICGFLRINKNSMSDGIKGKLFFIDIFDNTNYNYILNSWIFNVQPTFIQSDSHRLLAFLYRELIKTKRKKNLIKCILRKYFQCFFLENIGAFLVLCWLFSLVEVLQRVCSNSFHVHCRRFFVWFDFFSVVDIVLGLKCIMSLISCRKLYCYA